jgi:CelD/BcsL family acetyltransferase involved in cellulose biosynthesis
MTPAITANIARISSSQSQTIQLYRGADAMALLQDRGFQDSWDHLYTQCPWATVFQSRPFATSWYRLYHQKHPPILLAGFKGDQLTGLLTLAKSDHQLQCAGNRQAEYMAWLAPDDPSNTFIKQALTLVKKQFPQHVMAFKYVTGQVPLDWTNEAPWNQYCMLATFKRPLLKVDTAWADQKLKKRNRRNEVNQLKRQGLLTLERIRSEEQFAAIIDELITLFEFRKQAVYNRSYFSKDPLRKLFLLDQFRLNLLHVSVLKVNDTIIAAEVHTIEGARLYSVGINTHAPQYAKLSPGTLHKLLLTKALAEEGREEFDLTPGGESYKDELATHYDTVYSLTVGSSSKKLMATTLAAIGGFFKKSMARVASLWGINYEQLRLFRERQLPFFIDRLKTIRKQKPAQLTKTLLKYFTSWISAIITGKKATTYTRQVAPFDDPSFLYQVKTNSLQDLLALDTADTRLPRWQFFREAMHRLETGQTVYSWCLNGRLLACAWINKQPGATTPRLQLENIYFHTAGQSQLPAFLKAVIHQLSRNTDGSPLSVQVTPAQQALRQAVISLGFQPVA